MKRITGQKDRVSKLLRDLQTEQGRARARLFFVEGEELARRAFEYGGRVECLILTDNFASTPSAVGLVERADSAGVSAYTCTAGLLSKILQAKPTPECVAIVERRVAPLEDVLGADCALVVMVERGENADNLGMLLRSMDAGGVDGVVLAQTTDPFARRVVRGSRGAVFTVPISIRTESAGVIEEAKRRGLQAVATSAQADIPYTNVDYTRPTMIIVGNEHVGISNQVREMSDAVVRIPMRGRINSLNIAVAASVVLYEALRQRSAGAGRC